MTTSSNIRLLLAVLLAVLAPTPHVTGGGREKSNLDSRMSYIIMVANRIYWSMWAGLPYCGGVTDPQCWDSQKFQSSLEQDDKARFRLSDRLFIDAGLDPIANSKGLTAVWAAWCRPVSFGPTTYDDVRNGILFIRWPSLIDGNVFVRQLLDFLSGSEEIIQLYRIDAGRAKEIYEARRRQSGTNESESQQKHWTWTYPNLEIYLDRKIPAMMGFPIRLKGNLPPIETPKAGWSQIRIEVRPVLKR